MVPYKTNAGILHGTSYSEIRRNALDVFKRIRGKTKRKAYIRSAYFNKQKVFLDYFWDHLLQKHYKDRIRRLKYITASVELIQYSRNHPISRDSTEKEGELLHRFFGETKEGKEFYVQIKEVKQTGRKYFISCFPK